MTEWLLPKERIINMFSLLTYLREGMYFEAIISIISKAFVVFCCLPLHELAHGLVANKCGDHTAKAQGRLTINPFAHLDPIGTIMIFLFGIGYANPVPVRARNFKNPKKGMAVTALAGPAANLLMGFIAVCCYYIFLLFPVNTATYFIRLFFSYAASINVTLAVFNLLPIPPLDGSKVLAMVVPSKFYFKYMQYERYVMIALLALLFFGVLDTPIYYLSEFMMKIISFIPNLIYNLIV